VNADIVLILTTVPTAEAGETIARALVEERLAACVNVLAPMTSTYHWRGTVARDEERQLIIKTVRHVVPAVQARVAALHTYEVPELLVVPVAGGGASYLEWVRAETGAE
jgi:periplasmic divalent cation tolerance protein